MKLIRYGTPGQEQPDVLPTNPYGSEPVYGIRTRIPSKRDDCERALV